MMHRIKSLLLQSPKTRTFHELSALYRSYATTTAGGSRDGGQSRNYATAAAAEPFLNGSSSAYIEDMFEAWQSDPNSVHKVRLNVFCSTLCKKKCSQWYFHFKQDLFHLSQAEVQKFVNLVMIGLFDYVFALITQIW